MGLYIPNAKIPVSCNKCYEIGLAHRLRDLGGHCPRMDLHYSPDEQDFKGDRRVDCHLLDVPPHGRLGDLDAVRKEIDRLCDRYDAGIIEEFIWLNGVLAAICNAPTIIPAEPAEEGEP